MSERLCSNGHPNEEAARFCVVCGATVTEQAVQAPTPEPAKPGVPVSERLGAVPRRWWMIIGAAVVALVLILGGLFFVMTAPVPDVTASTLTAAQSEITGAGFAFGSSTKEFDAKVPRGKVVSQDPGAGSRTRKGGEVSVVISRGPAVTIPDVTGMSEVSAHSQLSRLNLDVTTSDESSTVVPAGEVISQGVRKGSVVEEGTTVALVISSGPPTTSITVTLTLYNGYDSCGFDYGYYDIPGGDVVIRADGEVVAVGNLPWRGDDGGSYCDFTTTLSGIPTDANNYSLDIGGGQRGGVDSTRSELEANDWQWDVSLGL